MRSQELAENFVGTDAMSETVRVKDIVETVVTDDDITLISNRVYICTEEEMSKAVTKAYRKAKKMCVAENARSRKIASDLRIKREGITEKMDMPNTTHPSPSEQASIFDY